MSVPATPTKTRSRSSLRETPRHSPSHSQVRFSLPETPCVEHSPSKIVYPNEDSGSSSFLGLQGQLIDLQTKVMVEVPEEVWRFHTERHRRAKSVQAAIVSTIDSVNKSFASSDVEDISNVSPLNLHRRNNSLPSLGRDKKELYLTAESPMNKHNVPVPLQISLPPFLSPKNKNKTRSSLVFDGTGYSPFKDHSSSEEVSEEISLQDSSIVSSIASAEHNVSLADIFNGKGSVDKVLGIDDEANVDLKQQIRNFRQTVKNDKKPEPQTIEKLETFPIESLQKQPVGSVTETTSLDVLESPSKQIFIPDLNAEISLQKTPNGTLTFFERVEGLQDQQQQFINNNRPDELMANFKFPQSKPQHNESDNDFLQINALENDNVTQRRQRLQQMQASTSSTGPNKHMHRRSRSVHSVSDIDLEPRSQSEVSTPSIIKLHPIELSKPNSIPIPQRSPLRLLNKSANSSSLSLLSNPTSALNTSIEPTQTNERPTVELPTLVSTNSTSEMVNEQVQVAESNEPNEVIPVQNIRLKKELHDYQQHLSDDELIRNSMQVENESSSYQETDSENSILPSPKFENLQSNVDSSLDNMTGYTYQDLSMSTSEISELADLAIEVKKTHEVTSSPVLSKKVEKNDMIVEIKLPASDEMEFNKPLSSFQSFQNPINIQNDTFLPLPDPKINFSLKEKEELTANTNNSHRTISITGSSVSENSQFSKHSYVTDVSSNPPIIEHTYISPNGQTGFQEIPQIAAKPLPISKPFPYSVKKPVAKASKASDHYESIYEMREGKIVEVIVIDDDGIDASVQKPQGNITRRLNTTNNTKKITHRKSHRRIKSCPDRMSHKKILDLCEDTASQAKTIIFGLVDRKVSNQTKIKVPIRPTPPIINVQELKRRLPVELKIDSTALSIKQYSNDTHSKNRKLREQRNRQPYLDNMSRSRKALSYGA